MRACVYCNDLISRIPFERSGAVGRHIPIRVVRKGLRGTRTLNFVSLTGHVAVRISGAHGERARAGRDRDGAFEGVVRCDDRRLACNGDHRGLAYRRCHAQHAARLLARQAIEVVVTRANDSIVDLLNRSVAGDVVAVRVPLQDRRRRVCTLLHRRRELVGRVVAIVPEGGIRACLLAPRQNVADRVVGVVELRNRRAARGLMMDRLEPPIGRVAEIGITRHLPIGIGRRR